jgi:light-regulated signal transduction histidine kinase (bacteriophytochrome)
VVIAFVEVTKLKKAEEEILRLNAGLEKEVAHRTRELTASNKELEAFCYAVSHDLRTPLRIIDGFSRILSKDLEERLSEEQKLNLNRVRSACQNLSHIIDSLLDLTRLTRNELRKEEVDLSDLARKIARDFQSSQPERRVEWIIPPDLRATGDAKLLHIVLQNLLDNAWKFTGKRADARIEVGRGEKDGKAAFFVKDNGAGFDMAFAEKLFGPFERLHRPDEFEGTGIGLASVQRIIQRHGGEAWAEGAVDEGATFYFSLP